MKSKIELESMFDNAQTMHLQEFINYYTPDTPNTGTVTGEIISTHNSAMLAAMEFGYIECEKGNNLDMAFINFNKALNNK